MSRIVVCGESEDPFRFPGPARPELLALLA